ncbi:MAG TPA: YqeG family HAD IIIA-type phosphatase [Caproicibacter sp.]|nr:YqeG family HAD IIIA-type phosphatase [Caproicibacter sp.]
MSLLIPTISLKKVMDITPELLNELSVEAILLDVDNTLALHGSQIPFPGTIDWSLRMREAGFEMIIMSNNFSKRVQPFAAKYGLPFLSMSLKPLPGAYWRAVDQLGVKREKAIVVGDQVFTDVLGANLARMKSILLVPAEEENSITFRVRRRLERPIRKFCAKEHKDKG